MAHVTGGGAYQRKRIYVDSPIQGALVRQTLLQWVLYSMAILAVLYLWEVVAGGLGMPLEDRARELWDRYSRLLIVVAMLAPVMVLLVIKTSHKFVGPMIRLRRAIAELAAGEKIRPVKFREGDYWQDLAVEFNAMVDRMGMLDHGDDAKWPGERASAPLELADDVEEHPRAVETPAV